MSLQEVVGERFLHPENDDLNVVIVPKNELFQGSYKTQWTCTLPYKISVSATPISGPSFGLFIEVENLFKVVIGDGDLKSIRIERNDTRYRGAWPTVTTPRLKLSKDITNKRTVVVDLYVRNEKEWMTVDIDVYHSGSTVPQHFTTQFIPLTFNPKQLQYPIRIGVNDSRFKGKGTEVRLETISITELSEEELKE